MTDGITRVDRWWSETPTPLAPPHHGEECEASWVHSSGDIGPCGVPATAWRIDSDDAGIAWPVCDAHSIDWAQS